MEETRALKNNEKQEAEIEVIEHLIEKLEEGEDIDPKSPEFKVAINAIRAEREIHSGPLPSPRTLKEYGEIDNNFPRVIVESFERQNNHRIEMEKRITESSIQNEKIGMILAFILAFIGLMGGLALSYFDKIGAGITTFIASLASLVGIFIYGKYQQSKELKMKDIEMLLNREEKND